MRMTHLDSPESEKASLPETEIDYSPREHSFKEQLMTGLKMAACAAVVFLAIWFFET